MIWLWCPRLNVTSLADKGVVIVEEICHSGAPLEKISLQYKVGIGRPNGPINFAGGSLVFHRLNFGNCSEASYLRSR